MAAKCLKPNNLVCLLLIRAQNIEAGVIGLNIGPEIILENKGKEIK